MNVILGLIIAAIVFLIIAAALLSGYIKFTDHRTSMYERRMAADANYDRIIMSSAKALPTPQGTWLVIGVLQSGVIKYAFQPTSGELPTTTDNLVLQAAHRTALEIVDASIREYGGVETRILPANRWSSGSAWDEGVRHMKDLDLVMTDGNKPNGKTITKRGNLFDLMLALSLAVPKALASPPAGVLAG